MKLSRAAEEGLFATLVALIAIPVTAAAVFVAVTGVGAWWLRVLAFVVLAAFAVGMVMRRRRYGEPVDDDSGEVTDDAPLDEFEALVRAELADIPDEFQHYLDNVAIVVEDEPPGPWLGVYQGSTTRYRGYSGKQPDVIRFFRGPMLRNYGHDPDVLAREVRRLVRHEVAHHFGISDQQLLEMDRY